MAKKEIVKQEIKADLTLPSEFKFISLILPKNFKLDSDFDDKNEIVKQRIKSLIFDTKNLMNMQMTKQK